MNGEWESEVVYQRKWRSDDSFTPYTELRKWRRRFWALALFDGIVVLFFVLITKQV